MKTSINNENLALEAVRLAKSVLSEKIEYFINPSQTNTERYVILSGGVFHTGRVGIKKGQTYIKFVEVPVHTQGKYKTLLEKGKLKKVSQSKLLDEIEDNTYMTNIDIKRMYKSSILTAKSILSDWSSDTVELGKQIKNRFKRYPWKYDRNAKAWMLTGKPLLKFYDEFWEQGMSRRDFRNKISKILGKFKNYDYVMDSEDSYMWISID